MNNSFNKTCYSFKTNNKKIINSSNKNYDSGIKTSSRGKQNLHNSFINNQNYSKNRHTSNTTITRSSSANRFKINNLNKILNNPEISNINTLQNIISEVKSNAFDRIKLEIENKIKEKNQLIKNIELIKSNLKLNNSESKFSIKNQFDLVNQNKQLKAIEQRINNEVIYGSGIDLVKEEVSRTKFEYENTMEENRYLRTIMLEDEKQINLMKEEIKKFNKLISDTRKEKEVIKPNLIKLQKHINLMREKVITLENKNKKLLIDFYSLSLD